MQSVPDDEWATLLGRPVQQGKVKIDRNMTLGELNHSRSPLGWLVAAVLGLLLCGKPPIGSSVLQDGEWISRSRGYGGTGVPASCPKARLGSV